MTKLLVRDLMTEDVVALGPDDSLATLRDVLDEQHVRYMPIVDDSGRLVGLVSQRDLLRFSLVDRVGVPEAVEQAVLERLRVRELMATEVYGVGPETDIREAAQTMLDNDFGCLPVVDRGRVVGILTESDFVRFLAQGQ